MHTIHCRQHRTILVCLSLFLAAWVLFNAKAAYNTTRVANYLSGRSEYPKSWPRVEGWRDGYRFDGTDPPTSSEAVSSPAAAHDELANQKSIVPPSTTLRAPTGDADQAIFDAEGWDF